MKRVTHIRYIAVAVLACLLSLNFSQAAQARGVFIGGGFYGAPAYSAAYYPAAPVYYTYPPQGYVYAAPPPVVYAAPPAYVAPAPVYVAPVAPVFPVIGNIRLNWH